MPLVDIFPMGCSSLWMRCNYPHNPRHSVRAVLVLILVRWTNLTDRVRSRLAYPRSGRPEEA